MRGRFRVSVAAIGKTTTLIYGEKNLACGDAKEFSKGEVSGTAFMQGNKSPQTVLLVENNPGDVFLLRRAFAKCGIPDRLQVTRDGEEAFAYLCGLDEFSDRAKYPWPSFIITDLKMPLVGGLELLKHLRVLPECRDMPVFIFSSSAQDKDVAEATRLGANGFFLKPVRIEEIEVIVRAIYERAAIVSRTSSAPSTANPRIETISA